MTDPDTPSAAVPVGVGRAIAVALVLIVPIALLVVWFQVSKHDNGWAACRAAIEQRLAPAQVAFNVGDHTFTDAGNYSSASGSLTAAGRTYEYQCIVSGGVVQRLQVQPQ